jgi:hypothetical protein
MESENLGTKQIEKILSTEISDWIRWGSSRDYLPPSFRCPLGFIYVPKRGDLEANLYKPAPIHLLNVFEFEKIVVSLPKKHRQAFVMHHLSLANVNGRVVKKKRTGYENARLLGVTRTKYYAILSQAHNLVFRKWKTLKEKPFKNI